jgi:hypothetical protein
MIGGHARRGLAGHHARNLRLAELPRGRGLPRYRQHTVSTPGVGLIRAWALACAVARRASRRKEQAMLGLRKALITAAVSVALVGGGTAAGAAVASSPVDGSGVILGCWTNAAINGAHVFVLQDAGTNCPNGATTISWNQTGPRQVHGRFPGLAEAA